MRPRRFLKNYLYTLAIVAGSRNIMASLVGKQVLLSILVQHIFCRSVMHQNEFFLPVSLYQGGQTERLLAVLAAGWVTGLSSQREREYFMTLFFHISTHEIVTLLSILRRC